MAAIQVQGLTKRFGSLLAVDNLSFDVADGKVVGLLGPNGAGKTTTLRMLLGLVTPSGGRALVNGRTYVDLLDPLHQVGAVLEAAGFHPSRTARDALRIQALAGDASASKIDEVLGVVDLADAAERRVGGFSLGMRQRLAIGMALLHDPEVLVLDEPANGLDPEGVRWLRGVIRDWARRGRTVLVSSHILAEVAQTVDDVIIIDHGHLIAQAPLAELTARAGRLIHVRTSKAQELSSLLRAEGVSAPVVGPDRIDITDATPNASAPSPPSTPSRSSRPALRPRTWRSSSSSSPAPVDQGRHDDEPARSRRGAYGGRRRVVAVRSLHVVGGVVVEEVHGVVNPDKLAHFRACLAVGLPPKTARSHQGHRATGGARR
jgi:ABC-2 type transport system ATP-binding protein